MPQTSPRTLRVVMAPDPTDPDTRRILEVLKGTKVPYKIMPWNKGADLWDQALRHRHVNSDASRNQVLVVAIRNTAVMRAVVCPTNERLLAFVEETRKP